MLAGLLQIIGIGGDIAKARSELKRAKLEAQTKAVLAAAESEKGWEQLAGENARNSWVDEFWTLVLAAPLILSFIPGLQPYVKAGFVALEGVPEWYRWALLAAISFAFARRKMPNLAGWVTRRR